MAMALPLGAARPPAYKHRQERWQAMYLSPRGGLMFVSLHGWLAVAAVVCLTGIQRARWVPLCRPAPTPAGSGGGASAEPCRQLDGGLAFSLLFAFCAGACYGGYLLARRRLQLCFPAVQQPRFFRLKSAARSAAVKSVSLAWQGQQIYLPLYLSCIYVLGWSPLELSAALFGYSVPAVSERMTSALRGEASPQGEGGRGEEREGCGGGLQSPSCNTNVYISGTDRIALI